MAKTYREDILDYGRYYDFTGKKKKKPGIETFPVGDELTGFESLTPSQQQANQALLDALMGQLGGGAAPFEFPSFPYEGVDPSDVGVLSAGGHPLAEQTLAELMSGGGTQPTQSLQDILSGIPTFGGELGGETKSAMERALSGEVSDVYAAKTRGDFERDVAPAVREEFGGPGTFWGTARAGAVTGERARMEENITADRKSVV